MVTTALKRNNRVVCAVLVAALILSAALTLPSTASAASSTQRENALTLFNYDILVGSTGTIQGVYNTLDNKTRRDEAATILVRLFGAETEAKTLNGRNPFSDAQSWQKPYVSWLYNNSLTNGISATRYGSSDLTNFQSYCTFMLRCLGYSESAGDFTYKTAVETLADMIYGTYTPVDPTDPEDIELAKLLTRTSQDTAKYWSYDPVVQRQTITRGDLANLTMLTLYADMKGTQDYYLIEYLYETGAITLAEANALGDGEAVKVN